MRASALLVILGGATAQAKRLPPPKLTKAETAAISTASTWVSALTAGKKSALTASPFFAVAYDDESTPCKPSGDTTCLHDKVTPKGKPKIWRHTLAGPLAAAQAKKIDELARGAIVVEWNEGCDGTENQLLVVVKKSKVTAAFAQTTACSE